jgi:hypothetical protein
MDADRVLRSTSKIATTLSFVGLSNKLRAIAGRRSGALRESQAAPQRDPNDLRVSKKSRANRIHVLLACVGMFHAVPSFAEPIAHAPRQALHEAVAFCDRGAPIERGGSFQVTHEKSAYRIGGFIPLLALVAPDRLPVADEKAHKKSDQWNRWFENFYHEHPLRFEAIELVILFALGVLFGCGFELDAMAEIYRTPRDWVREIRFAVSEWRARPTAAWIDLQARRALQDAGVRPHARAGRSHLKPSYDGRKHAAAAPQSPNSHARLIPSLTHHHPENPWTHKPQAPSRPQPTGRPSPPCCARSACPPSARTGSSRAASSPASCARPKATAR